MSEISKMASTRFGSTSLLSDAASAADIILSQALEFCNKQMDLDNSETALEQLRQDDRITSSYFKFGLVKKAAEHLGTCDDDIRAVYIYDHDVISEAVHGSDARHRWLAHLIVWAEPKTAALNSLIAALDWALAQSFGKLISEPTLRHLLDVQVIDDTDVRCRAGCAALLLSPHHLPDQVWKRERRDSMSHHMSSTKEAPRLFSAPLEIERPALELAVLRALEKERQSLLKRIRQQEQLLAQDEAMNGNDIVDNADRMSGQSHRLAMRRLWENMLKEVERAIIRIEHGTYGSCEHCGRAIPEERLRALPSAALCINCARLQVQNVHAV